MFRKKRDTTSVGTNYQRNKTHCDKGHEHNSENTYFYKGHRTCKICRRERVNKRQSENREYYALKAKEFRLKRKLKLEKQ